MVDTTSAFKEFSSTGTFNISTANLERGDLLVQALSSPITETVIGSIRSDVTNSSLSPLLATIAESIRDSGFGVSGSYGTEVQGGERTLIVVNGWKDQQVRL